MDLLNKKKLNGDLNQLNKTKLNGNTNQLDNKELNGNANQLNKKELNDDTNQLNKKQLINDIDSINKKELIKLNNNIESLKLIKMYQDMYEESNYINITELMKLTNVGIPLEDLTFSKTKMSNEHCICVRHTCIKRKQFNLNKTKELNGHQYNGKAKFFLNEDELSSSFDSKKDYQFNSNSYDKYSNGRNSISSDRSDESTKQQLSSSFQLSKSKKNSFNSKFKLYNSNDKTNYFTSNSYNIYKSENNLDKNLCYSTSTLSRNGRKMMIKSNSFNNIINNYKSNGIYRSNTDNYNSNNSNLQFTNNNQLEIPKLINNQQLKQKSQQTSSKFTTEFSSILYLINPYDARINKFETDYVKIAILNPIRTFIAVSSTNYTVHVLSTKSCQVIATTHLDENVEFICWLTPLIIAIITTKTVYHWDLKNNCNQPYIVFLKSPKIFNCEIINYEANDQMNWYALSCLYLEEDGKTITGLVQIHHIDDQTKLNGYELDSNNNCFFQTIEAHSVSFAQIKFNENNIESTTLIAIKKTSCNTIKVYIIELGPLNPKNNLLIARTEILRFNDNVNGYQFDIPLYNIICSKLSLIYIISKYGRLIICDLQTGYQLPLSISNEQQIISEDVIISAKLDISDNQSIICMNRSGQVLLIEFDFINLLKQFSNDNKLKKIGKRIKFALNDINDEVTRL